MPEDAEALREEIDALRTRLDVLEAKNRDRARATTMRGNRGCTACGEKRLLLVRWVQDRDGNQRSVPMSVGTKGWWLPEGVGLFSLVICSACGAVEWWVLDPQSIEVDGDQVQETVLDDEGTDRGPFR